MYYLHVLAWVLLLCSSANVIPRRTHHLWTLLASWRQLVWHPSSPESELWTGQESRPQDTRGCLGSHSRSGQGSQTMSVTL